LDLGHSFMPQQGWKRTVIGNQEHITYRRDIPLSGANCLMHI